MRTTHQFVNLLAFCIALFCIPGLPAQQTPGAQDLPDFLGRKVTIATPEIDVGGFFPKGPASICIEGPPQRQCYTALRDDKFSFGKNPTAEIVQLEQGKPAIFFSAQSGGVSGSQIHFSLLRPNTGKELQDLLSGVTVSNQSQHAFWTEAAISEAPIFLTADYVWGPDEGHYGEHRFIISVYMLKSSASPDGFYYLEDQYMTIRKYDLEETPDLLTSEKPEIIRRLMRIKSEAPH